MDTKKVLQLLVRIADKQQKIINKMAQANTDVTIQDKPQGAAPNQPPPTSLKAGPVSHADPAQALLAALPPNIKATVNGIKVNGPDMHVQFQPGKMNQATYDVVLKTLQNLTNQGVVQHAFNLKAV